MIIVSRDQRRLLESQQRLHSSQQRPLCSRGSLLRSTDPRLYNKCLGERGYATQLEDFSACYLNQEDPFE